jgi:hypothetical protein
MAGASPVTSVVVRGSALSFAANDRGLGPSRDETRDRRRFEQPVGHVGHGFQGPQPFESAGRAKRHQVAPGVGRSGDGNRHRLTPRRFDPQGSGADPALPIRRRAPGIIHNDQKRPGAIDRGAERIPDRTRHRQDDGGRDGEAQQEKPPRRIGRGLVLRFEVENEPERRKWHATRPGRRDAQ